MVQVSSSVVIRKPIQEVFAYTASPVNGPAFIPNLSENTNIRPKQSCAGQTFDWRFNMAGVDLKGKAEVTEFVPPQRVKIVTTGDNNTTWLYTFEEFDGGTRVTAQVVYELVESAFRKIANKLIIDKLNQRTAEQMLHNLKTILES